MLPIIITILPRQQWARSRAIAERTKPREERSPSFRKVATRAHFGRVKEILTTNHSKSENQEEELKKLT